MAIKDWLKTFDKKLTEKVRSPFKLLGTPNGKNKFVNEQFKGEVLKNEFPINPELGEEHPFSFALVEGLYAKFPFITGVIDKYVDFIVGPGFFVKSEDPKAEEIIEQFLKDVNFDMVLRRWVKEALIKGTGILEIGGSEKEGVQGLKVLDSKWVFIKRDDKGVIERFNQLKLSKRGLLGTASLGVGDFTPFEPKQIAPLTFSNLGDSPYGLGIIQPTVEVVDAYLKALKDMHMLISRKANSPYWFKVGDLAHTETIPQEGDLQNIANDLQSQNNKAEWVTGPEVNIQTLDFGNIGEKFDSVLKTDEDLLFFGFQIPEVLMGRGRVPEGLATVQMEAFQRNIQSKQQEIEKVIEENIFRRVLQANQLDVHVEFEWGRPSDSENNMRMAKLIEILKNPVLSFGLRQETEKELARLLGFDEVEVQEANEKADGEKVGTKERENEENKKQPVVPGENPSKGRPKRKQNLDIYNSFRSYIPKDVVGLTEFVKEDYTLNEWLGFRYQTYLEMILLSIQRDNFSFLLAKTSADLEAGMLTTSQINKLKSVMTAGFRDGKTIKQISRDIFKKVKPKDLLRMKDGVIQRGASGLPLLALRKEMRAIAIARTETTRLAANGLIEHFRNGGAEKVRFLATLSQRTCPQCEELNGRVFGINEIQNIIPVHSMCRCTWIALNEETGGT